LVAFPALASENEAGISLFLGPVMLVLGLIGLGLVWRAGWLRLGAVPEGWGRLGPVLLGVGAMMFLAQLVVYGVVLGVMGSEADELGESEQAIAFGSALVASLVVGLVGIGFTPLRKRRAGMVKEVVTGVLGGVVGFGVMFPLAAGSGWAALVVAQLLGFEADPVGHELLGKAREGLEPAIVAQLGMAVLLAPVVEELLYRRYLQGGLIGVLAVGGTAGGRAADGSGGRAGVRWLGVLITTGLFVSMHAGVVPPPMLVSIGVVGLSCGIAMERTGRVLVPVVMHMLFNLANVGITLLGMSG